MSRTTNFIRLLRRFRNEQERFEASMEELFWHKNEDGNWPKEWYRGTETVSATSAWAHYLIHGDVVDLRGEE